MKKAMIDYMKNIKNDKLYTPEYAKKLLLKYGNVLMAIFKELI